MKSCLGKISSNPSTWTPVIKSWISVPNKPKPQTRRVIQKKTTISMDCSRARIRQHKRNPGRSVKSLIKFWRLPICKTTSTLIFWTGQTRTRSLWHWTLSFTYGQDAQHKWLNYMRRATQAITFVLFHFAMITSWRSETVLDKSRSSILWRWRKITTLKATMDVLAVLIGHADFWQADLAMEQSPHGTLEVELSINTKPMDRKFVD